MGAGGSTQTPKRHDRRSRGSRDSEDTGSTASAFGRGDRERCLLHAQALDRHASLLPDHARLELEALITTLEHGRVYDDDDDSKASSINDLQHFAPHPNEKVQTWLRTTLCTDQEGRDARKSADVTDARTSVTGLPSTFLLSDARTSVSTLRGSQTDIIAAAAAGDLEALRKTPKERIDDGDYDQRTALHLAASNGRLTVVACLVDELGANVSPIDRWGGTPLDDAVRHSHISVREFLEGKGALRGVSQPGEWDEGADLCDAAKKGDMSRLRRLALQKQKGCDQADYDGRCALHLASCSGRLDVVKLLVEELNAALEVTDRWGGTPLDDAEREGHTPVVEYLIARGAPRGYSRRSRRATLDDSPEELDDVDVQVRVTEAWLAALKERRYVEEFDADGEDEGALPSFTSVDAWTGDEAFDIDSWEYDVVKLHERTGGHALAAVGPILLRRHSLIERCSLDTKVAQNFFAAVEANYGANPYHNAVHAADVAVAVHLFLSEHDLMEARFADPVACLAVLIAGVVHDFAHPGTTNPHEVKTASVRHKAFGDAGILEKFHVRAAFALMRDPRLNILAPLDHTGYARARRTIVKAVLATDLGRHMTYVERLNEMAMLEGARSHNTRVNSSKEQTWTSPFLDPEKCGRDLVAAVALKFADLGHACKKRILHEEWTARITNEFWNLGERERSLNVAISPLCDRQTDVDVAKSQVGFFSFICMPFYAVVADLVDPDMLPLSRLKQNLRYWQTKKHARRWEAAARVAGPLRRPA